MHEIPLLINIGVALAAARRIAPSLPIVARASQAEGVSELAKLGADDVIVNGAAP